MTLSAAIDYINDAFFFNRALSRPDRLKLARTIAATHGKDGAYAKTFALSARERHAGIRLFTGEHTIAAAARHITGEEACRALILLDVPDPQVRQSLAAAMAGLLRCLTTSERQPEKHMAGNSGAFCCGRCTVAVWRHLSVGGLDRQEERLRHGLRLLKTYRNANHGWRVFPFWYTALALGEIAAHFDIPAALQELRHIAPALDRSLKLRPRSGVLVRRREVASRALGLL